MRGYEDSPQATAEAMRDGYYHTGDMATRDADGYITFVGRADDVFKASDYRISPFELESVLIEHEAVAEGGGRAEPRSAPAGRAQGLRDPAPARASPARARRATSSLSRAGSSPRTSACAGSSSSPSCPRRISGKIRRVELRRAESERRQRGLREPLEYFEEDFPDLKRD